MSAWKRFRYSAEAAGCRLLAWWIPRLSRPACLRLERALGSLAYRLDGRGRSVALENLRCVFGSRYTPAEQDEILRASYRNFVRTMIDLFWGLRFTRENIHEWVSIENQELIQPLLAGGRGAIFMCLHHGNWEWANLLGPAVGWPLVSVAEDFKNPQLTALFQHLREHTGGTIIPQENSLIRMLKHVRRGGLSGMLCDLNLRPTQAATVIEAFRGPDGRGLLMCVPLLHAVLAQRGRALLSPFTSRTLPDGRVVLTMLHVVEIAPEATLREITQACWDSLEPTVLARPEDYLWPYKHFRYRPADASREYPSYANASKKFDKLRASAV